MTIELNSRIVSNLSSQQIAFYSNEPLTAFENVKGSQKAVKYLGSPLSFNESLTIRTKDGRVATPTDTKGEKRTENDLFSPGDPGHLPVKHYLLLTFFFCIPPFSYIFSWRRFG